MKIFDDVKRKLKKEDKIAIKSAFEELKTNGKDEKLKSTLSIVTSKIERLENSDDLYKNTLAWLTKAFTAAVLRGDNTSERLRSLAIIAIAYLCDPYDVIPDSDPEDGYLDDLYIFYLVLTEIKSECPKTHANICNTYYEISCG